LTSKNTLKSHAKKLKNMFFELFLCFFEKNIRKSLVDSKKLLTFAPAIQQES